MKLPLILILMMLGFGAFAQDKILPMDESGKYTFLEVAELKAVSKSMMAANARRFFKINPKSLKLTAGEKDTVFLGKGKMIVQKGVAGIGHPSAEVNYAISLALREGKYRLIMTDFVVTPYERDRYGNFVPVTVSTALEKSPGKLGRAEWEADMAFIFTESGKIADKLRTTMSNTLAEPKTEQKKPATVSTTKW
jgi:hypothetical protein